VLYEAKLSKTRDGCALWVFRIKHSAKLSCYSTWKQHNAGVIY